MRSGLPGFRDSGRAAASGGGGPQLARLVSAPQAAARKGYCPSLRSIQRDRRLRPEKDNDTRSVGKYRRLRPKSALGAESMNQQY